MKLATHLLSAAVALSAATCFVDFDEFTFDPSLAAGGGGGAGSGGSGVGGLFGECSDATQCPAATTSCQTPNCFGGSCGFDNVAQGTACTDGGGSLCDGFGNCVACVSNADCPGTQQCQNFQCMGVDCTDTVKNGDETDVDCGGSCPDCANGQMCGDGNDCVSGFCDQGSCGPCGTDGDCADVTDTYCNAGTCDPKKADASVCVTPSECLSGQCADGLCCDTACANTCEACAASISGGVDGVCSFIPLLQDPENECMSGEHCQGDGTCGTCGLSDPPLGGTCPAVCDGGCANDVCVITCNNGQECKDMTVNCPAGFACEVQCTGNQGCQGATINCPANHACSVQCTGQQACRNGNVQCSSGACDVTCSADNQACSNNTVTCGSNACTASCAPMGTQPTVVCGGSCSCTPC